MKSIKALKWSLEALLDEGAWVYVFTFWSVRDYKVMSANWGKFQAALKKRTGWYGVRVYELGDLTERLHVHVICNCLLDWEDIKLARWGTLILDFRECGPAGPGVIGYVLGEMMKGFFRKGSDEDDPIERKWATFGDWPGRERARDIQFQGEMEDCWGLVNEFSEPGADKEARAKEVWRMYFVRAVIQQRITEADREEVNKDEREAIQWCERHGQPEAGDRDSSGENRDSECPF